MKHHEARRFIGNGDKLGKRVYKWEVPCNLQDLAIKKKAILIGLGEWVNTHEKYWCISSEKGNIYLTAKSEALELIRKQKI